MSSKPESPPRAPARGTSVLDPEWEDALRRGQEAEGEAGSVDAELAYVHLLRHTRAPEALEPAELDSLWSEIDAELWPAATPWWRKAWVWWMAPAAAAAAVLFVVVVEPGQQAEDSVARSEDKVELADDAPAAPAPAAELQEEAEAEPQADANADGDAQRSAGGAAKAKREASSAGVAADDDRVASSSKFASLQATFTRMTPNGRRAIRVSVDQSRDLLRGQLLELAKGGG